MVNYKKIKTFFERLNFDFTTFKIVRFIEHIENYRQRSILSVPYPFSPGVSGAWIPGTMVDFLFFQSQTHPMHQNHIILHELAHMVLNHPLKPVDQVLPPELLKELSNAHQGHLRTLEVNRAKDMYEQEAEYFVALIQRQVVSAHRMIELTTGDSSITNLKPFVQGLPFQDEQWRKKK